MYRAVSIASGIVREQVAGHAPRSRTLGDTKDGLTSFLSALGRQSDATSLEPLGVPVDACEQND